MKPWLSKKKSAIDSSTSQNLRTMPLIASSIRQISNAQNQGNIPLISSSIKDISNSQQKPLVKQISSTQNQENKPLIETSAQQISNPQNKPLVESSANQTSSAQNQQNKSLIASSLKQISNAQNQANAVISTYQQNTAINANIIKQILHELIDKSITDSKNSVKNEVQLIDLKQSSQIKQVQADQPILEKRKSAPELNNSQPQLAIVEQRIPKEQSIQSERAESSDMEQKIEQLEQVPKIIEASEQSQFGMDKEQQMLRQKEMMRFAEEEKTRRKLNDEEELRRLSQQLQKSKVIRELLNQQQSFLKQGAISLIVGTIATVVSHALFKKNKLTAVMGLTATALTFVFQ